MDKIQKDFIIETFFVNSYAGSANIAEKLLTVGSALVAGDTPIWLGGVGNFIETKTYAEAPNCLLYKLDLNALLTSAWFQQELRMKIVKLTVEADALGRELNSLKELDK